MWEIKKLDKEILKLNEKDLLNYMNEISKGKLDDLIDKNRSLFSGGIGVSTLIEEKKLTYEEFKKRDFKIVIYPKSEINEYLFKGDEK